MLILYGISEGKQTKIGEFETFEECDKAIEEFKTIENELFKNNEITYVVKEEEKKNEGICSLSIRLYRK